MLNPSHFISKCASTALIISSLILGACGEKNKSEGVKKQSVIYQTVSVPDYEVRSFTPHKAPIAERERALKLMGLFEMEEGGIVWDEKFEDENHYTYSNVIIHGDAGEIINIGELELRGVYMAGEFPAIDEIITRDMSADDLPNRSADNEYPAPLQASAGFQATEMKIDTVIIRQLSPAFNTALWKVFNGDQTALENYDGDFKFGSYAVHGIRAKGQDAIFTLDKLDMGVAKDGTGYFSLKNARSIPKAGASENFKLESYDVRGLNLEKIGYMIANIQQDAPENVEEIAEEMNAETLKNHLRSLDPFVANFTHSGLRGLFIDAQGLLIKWDAQDSQYSVSDQIATLQSTATPFVITPPKTANTEAMTGFVEGMKALGYEQLVFNIGQKTILNQATDRVEIENGFLSLDDGFTLSYNAQMEGLGTFIETVLDSPALENGQVDEEKLDEALLAIKTLAVQMKFKDESIIERGFTLAADFQGTSPKFLKTQAKAAVHALGFAAQDDAQRQLASDFANAVNTLIDNTTLNTGKSLRVEIDPKLHLLESAITDESVDITVLNLSISAE